MKKSLVCTALFVSAILAVARAMDLTEANWDSATADVDCTVEESLCARYNIEGFPTVKYGDPSALKDYEGGRDYEELLEFSKENLGPVCGLKSLENCDDATKQAIIDAQKLSNEEIESTLKLRRDAIATLESDFELKVEELSAQYEALQKEKDSAVAELKKSGTPPLNILKMISTDRGLDPQADDLTGDDDFNPEDFEEAPEGEEGEDESYGEDGDEDDDEDDASEHDDAGEGDGL